MSGDVGFMADPGEGIPPDDMPGDRGPLKSGNVWSLTQFYPCRFFTTYFALYQGGVTPAPVYVGGEIEEN